jgi:hypothetical protein
VSRASQPVNPYIGLTFVPDNPRMEVPPAWFLGRLHDYDADLVMLPSRARPFAYVLARRARFSGGLTEKALEKTITQPDTKMCFQYGLVPVCLLYKHGPVWNADTVLNRLAARDTWTQGGGEALANRLESEEAAVVAKRREDKKDELRQQSKSAWRSYQQRTGQRTIVPGPSRPGAATKSSSSSTATGVTLA